MYDYSYLITDTKMLHSRIDYTHSGEQTGVRPDFALVSRDYLAVIAQQHATDERGALATLGITVSEEAAQWIVS